MSPDEEIELKEALDNLGERFHLAGQLFLYIEGTRVKVIGNMSFAALAPIIMRTISDKLEKR